MSRLGILRGRQVNSATLTPSNTIFEMDGGVILAIYNSYILTNANSDESLSVVGAKVIRVREEVMSVTFEFDSNVKVVVDLSDNGYSSPEAMQLIVPGMPTVVWN